MSLIEQNLLQIELAVSVPDLPEILAILSYLAVIVGIPLVLLQLRQNNRLREGEVVLSMMRALTEATLMKNWTMINHSLYRTYDDLLNEPDQKKRDEFMDSLEQMAGTFEGCGVLVGRGIISIDVIDYYLHGFIREIWSRVGPIIRGYREATQHYEYSEWLEFLYQRIYGGLSNKQALGEITARRAMREPVKS